MSAPSSDPGYTPTHEGTDELRLIVDNIEQLRTRLETVALELVEGWQYDRILYNSVLYDVMHVRDGLENTYQAVSQRVYEVGQ